MPHYCVRCGMKLAPIEQGFEKVISGVLLVLLGSSWLAILLALWGEVHLSALHIVLITIVHLTYFGWSYNYRRTSSP